MFTSSTPRVAMPSPPSEHESPLVADKKPLASATSPRMKRKSKIHMHPAKRRLLLVLVLGSVLGVALVMATLRLVIAPTQRWSVSLLDGMTQLERLDASVARLRNTTLASTQRMKLFLTQLQKLHAASTTRTGLVEKAAAQSYREHARDRLREHFMAIKEGILLHTSQRRRIDDARLELRQMNLSAEWLLLHIDEEEQVQLTDAENDNALSASTSLAQSIREIRATMMEHSVVARNTTIDELVAHVDEVLTSVDNFTRLSPEIAMPTEADEHGLLVYVAVFGVVGMWLWNVITDERTRKTSVVFMMHRAFLRALGNMVIVERVGDSSDDEDY